MYTKNAFFFKLLQHIPLYIAQTNDMSKQNIKTICIFGDDGILLSNGQFHLVCWMGTHAAAID